MYSQCSQPVAHSSPAHAICSNFEKPCSKTLLIALGVILMIGGLVATGCLYNAYGMAAFWAVGAGFGLGLLPIMVAACQKSVSRTVIPLSYDGTMTPAKERATKLQNGFGGMSDYSCISPETVRHVQETRFEKWKERAIGVMLGMAVGDSVGAPYEFLLFNPEGYKEHETLEPFNLLPGQWTDTSMGLCLADMLLVDRNLNETQLVLAFYDWWYHGYNNAFTEGPYRTSVGLGGNIGQSLHAMEEISRDDMAVSRPTTAGNRFTSGNGSLMRNGPVAIIAENISEARSLAARQSKTTHQGDEAAACCELMAYILFLAIHAETEDPEEIKSLILKKLPKFHCEVESVNALAQNQRRTKNPNTQEWENWNWIDTEFEFNAGRLELLPGYIGSYAMDGLAMALHCVFTTDSFEAAVLKAATRGGDADTVGAITGQIAGAIYGRDAIPQKWLDDVQRWDRGGEIAARGYLLTL
jgi:ADP-ribosyl-[dinitrogen reductase] hydrolase